MKAERLNLIKTHCENLKQIFPAIAEPDAVRLYQALRKIERSANATVIAFCNGDIDSNQYESRVEKVMLKLDALLGFRAARVPLFINGDPRGYIIKIEQEYMRANNIRLYSDWGGYGIIAPELR